MKILQTILACLILLIGQGALSYAVDPKGEVIPQNIWRKVLCISLIPKMSTISTYP